MTFLVAVLCAYRITRLVAIDAIFEGTRGRIQVWGANQRNLVGYKIGYLVGCPWCAGVWVALIVACAVLRAWPWQLGVAGWVWAGGLAGAAALVHAVEDTLGRVSPSTE